MSRMLGSGFLRILDVRICHMLQSRCNQSPCWNQSLEYLFRETYTALPMPITVVAGVRAYLCQKT